MGLRRAAALALAGGVVACVAGAPPLGSREAAGPLPFVWPRDGFVTLMTCRFETLQPIGVVLENATREDETAVDAVLRAWERAGLGVRFLSAPPEHAQLVIAFRDEPLPNAGRAVADCRLAGARAELAEARVEISHGVADARGGPNAGPPLTREELLGTIARETGRALGYGGSAPARDPLHVGARAETARVGGVIRSGGALESPSLRALYALPSGSVIARAAALPPATTRPIERLAALAQASDLDGPFLRTASAAARVFWRDRATGDEYGAQIVAPARLLRAPGRVAIAFEARARRALPRSRDAAADASQSAP